MAHAVGLWDKDSIDHMTSSRSLTQPVRLPWSLLCLLSSLATSEMAVGDNPFLFRNLLPVGVGRPEDSRVAGSCPSSGAAQAAQSSTDSLHYCHLVRVSGVSGPCQA